MTLVVPLIAVMVFGVLEFSLLEIDYITLTNATRAAARIGAADGSGKAAGIDPNTGGYVTKVDYDVLSALKDAAARDRSAIVQVVIFDPLKGGLGACTSSGGKYTSTPGVCNAYTAQNIANDLVPANFGKQPNPAGLDLSWFQDTRNDSVAGGGVTGSMGLYAQYKHSFITQLFGASDNISSTTVVQLEPH